MLTGRCGCGAVTYRMTSAPMFVHCCHCRDCQRQSGSAFAVNAIIETERVEVEGETVEQMLPTPSGKGQKVTRCAACGVAVFSAYMVREGKLRYVRVGTLDAPELCPPDVHIHTASDPDWLHLDDGIPNHKEFYGFWKSWPEPAQARWREVFG